MPAYIVTRHARERYVERFTHKDAYAHLERCEGCPGCNSYIFDIERKLADKKSLTQTILERVSRAKETRVYANNPNLMESYYNKYGYDTRFRFLIDNDVVFVIIEYEVGHKIVTCMHSETSFLRHFIFRPKYGKKKCIV